ncbi:PREDICTED: protein BRANCHLESS TRICHOME-like [Camelina sativa]|uniref:Protein BRANCHLESS TRICHOME-like n=1 Tax=Camelina sativa TaxID=90675 RepID=A0ABM0XZA6_CAMSA|nr:PREDICTED: protein BRANCHLESS TRICHOME-like [Camelina sativa]
MESITKWDLGSLRTYYSIEPWEKFQEEEVLDISLVPQLQGELWKAQSRIKELEAEKYGSCFIRNQRFEREKTTDPAVDYLKEKLSKEREEMKRAKAENSRLKKKILNMESSVNRLRRERDTMEKVCEELVTRIDELKANARRMWNETEEEREMLQMAEMWREERVRVKFTEAKLSLQEKYEEMDLYVNELEKCLEMAKEVGGIDEMRLRRGEGLIKIARSLEPIDDKIRF